MIPTVRNSEQGNKIMTKKEIELKNQIKILNEEIWAMCRHIADYRARHDIMALRLRDVSQKVAPTPAWYSDKKHKWLDAVAHSAAETLRLVSTMSLREAP